MVNDCLLATDSMMWKSVLNEYRLVRGGTVVSKRIRSESVRGIWREVSVIFVVLMFFGMTALLMLLGFYPTVTMAVITTMCLAAAELIRRLRGAVPNSYDRKNGVCARENS